MLLWSVYTRRAENQYWRLCFVVPAGVAESDVEECVRIVNDAMEDGYRHMWLLLRQDESEVAAKLDETQSYYRG